MFNAYNMVQQLRAELSESSAKHWADAELIGNLSQAQSMIYRKIGMSKGDWFIKRSDSITPSSSQIALPVDCAKPVHLEEVVSGNEIPLGGLTVRERKVERISPTNLIYGSIYAYPIEGYLEVNQDSYTTAVYLWYERRLPLLQGGTAAAGGTNSLTFPDDRNSAWIDDYYNGAYIEAVSGTGAGTRAQITDYVGSTRVATVAGTFDSDTVFGLVPVIPTEGYDVLYLQAKLLSLMKPGAVKMKEHYFFVRDLARDAMSDFEDWLSTQIKTSSRVRYTGAYNG